MISLYRIDDIEDNSCLRRGVPVAHSIYGVASTINAANYVLFLALEKVQQLGHPDVSTRAHGLHTGLSKTSTYFNFLSCALGNTNLHRAIVGIASWPRHGNLLA